MNHRFLFQMLSTQKFLEFRSLISKVLTQNEVFTIETILERSKNPKFELLVWFKN